MIEIEVKEYSVSEISFAIKQEVENRFGLVKVKGEIFGAKRADSGHWYLSLKDENAVLSAVCWKGVANNLPVKIADGLEVVALGKITTYPGRSSYQLVIEALEVSGTGALLKLLEERKQQFLKEGLFDAAHKKPVPYLPSSIGVVTSASGAVIRDIIHRIRDRFPTPLLLIPTPVQGQGAELKIAEAIRTFNQMSQDRPDVLIVARGGGSLEDLWCFNEEVVIRAVYESEIPIISAVGHETDTMLIDYVADLRAPTPTGAAEMAVPVREDLLINLNNLQNRLQNGILRYFAELKNHLEGLARGIPNLQQFVMEKAQKLDDRIERLNLSFKHLMENKAEKLNNLALRLDSVSVEQVLKRGFAYVTDLKGKIVSSAKTASQKISLNLNFYDGQTTVKTLSKKDENEPDLFDL